MNDQVQKIAEMIFPNSKPASKDVQRAKAILSQVRGAQEEKIKDLTRDHFKDDTYFAAYEAGSEEKEREMLEFAAWLVSEKGKDLDCNFIYYRNPTEAYLYWKKEVKTKKEL